MEKEREWSDQDIRQIVERGMSLRQVEEQLENFRKGFPFLPVTASASTAKGIRLYSAEERRKFAAIWSDYLSQEKEVVKFVPASGAASRMFKDLFEYLNGEESQAPGGAVKQFFDEIEHFAFYRELNSVCLSNEGKSIPELVAGGAYKAVIGNLLLSKGLNYGSLPKGLLLFHPYPDGARTAMEEHLVEGALYACNRSRQVNLHFTTSPEHSELFRRSAEEKRSFYERKYGVNYRISFSEQKLSTDTIAVDLGNRPFREEDGRLLFRPGGHGALIENLNDISADIVFIKNIDNVVTDLFKEPTVSYKQLLAGVLVDTQQKIFDYLDRIDSGQYTHEELLQMLYFLQNELFVKNPETKMLEDVELVLYIKSKLNRPLRVCGMVRNSGEPGGGPFRAVNPDGTKSLQILESSQIDLDDPEKRALFEQGTHFNPVDLVCGLRNYKGEKFHLPDYIDRNTGFISRKSKNGRELKAQELPGLWNGSMSDWNTLFVDVPLETFNPVKTFNDLLRREHRG